MGCFITYHWPWLVNIETANIGSTYIRGTYARDFCTKDIYIKGICIGDAYSIKDTFIVI